MELVKTTLKELSNKKIHALRRMTLRPNSMMWRCLQEERDNPEVQIIIAKQKNIYLAWGLTKPYKNGRSFMMIFVRPKYRRQGIGSTLAKAFQKSGVNLCYRWDSISASFYDTLKLDNVYYHKPEMGE